MSEKQQPEAPTAEGNPRAADICLQCVSYTRADVKDCTAAIGCPLWPYRIAESSMSRVVGLLAFALCMFALLATPVSLVVALLNPDLGIQSW